MSNEAKLKAAFSEALDVDEERLDWASLKYRGIEQWDSVAHMRLVGEIEDAFDVMLETEDVIDMSSFEKSKEILTKNGVSFDG
ncbi:acyl carrier protein [Blastococcus sp. Marseille-P5729]|uniref:acyl carrier protein n=1 Tax=Blastococcus sp. Marseille-P5729 TaxID=2086582 RepID=UPI000D0EB327|nr:acyl carrier protein [Blastococcus sp. Marseille-P5729]